MDVVTLLHELSAICASPRSLYRRTSRVGRGHRRGGPFAETAHSDTEVDDIVADRQDLRTAHRDLRADLGSSGGRSDGDSWKGDSWKNGDRDARSGGRDDRRIHMQDLRASAAAGRSTLGQAAGGKAGAATTAGARSGTSPGTKGVLTASTLASTAAAEHAGKPQETQATHTAWHHYLFW